MEEIEKLIPKRKRYKGLILPALILGPLVIFGFMGGVENIKEAMGNIFGAQKTELVEVLDTSEFEPDLSSSEVDRVIEGSIEGESLFQGKVDINLATHSQLQQVKGVGPVIAGRIIEYRNTHGFFASIEDIKQVKGIGEKTFLEMKDQIIVGQ